ncbi:MAG: dehydratase [Chloroflexi bacterium]|nr:dehydratase [Chloroflexota bacterium]
MKKKTWEEFSVGEEVSSIHSLTITEAHLVSWGHLTMDFYPLHMDANFASNTVFGKRIAHGPLIFSLGVGMMTSTGFYGDAVMAWLGIENMKIPKPVFIGDTLYTIGNVLEKKETGKTDRGVMIMHYEILNQEDETVMAYDLIFLIRRKAERK